MGTQALPRRLFFSSPRWLGRTLVSRHYSTSTKTSTADVQELYQAIRQGQRAALSRAITLVESTKYEHQKQATELLQLALAESTANATATPTSQPTTPSPLAFRIGLSGSPGVGKSTFIEAFGTQLTEMGHRLAVLAVDPSSVITGGSILGDKTRMPNLSRNPQAYIRPSPSRGTLGGVAKNTHESMLLCEAAGYDICLVETVGVGQSETMVADMVDMFILLVPPGGGDELQGLKKGVMELADMVIVNKADGELLNAACRAKMEYTSALKFMHPRTPEWRVPVTMVSAMTGKGLPEAWTTIQQFRATCESQGLLQQRRGEQRKRWLWNNVSTLLTQKLTSDPELRQASQRLEDQVVAGTVTSSGAARQILDRVLDQWHRERLKRQQPRA